jgi:hypothetical protein
MIDLPPDLGNENRFGLSCAFNCWLSFSCCAFNLFPGSGGDKPNRAPRVVECRQFCQRDNDPMLPSDPRFRHWRNLETPIGDLSRTELEWQVLIPGFAAIRTRRCSSFAEANRPKTMEVANIPGFSDHYLLLSKRKCDMMIPVGNPKSDL